MICLVVMLSLSVLQIAGSVDIGNGIRVKALSFVSSLATLKKKVGGSRLL